MNWQGQTVLVTGAGGFIGSHLVERLVELGAQVRALAHYNSRNDWGLLEMLPAAIKNEIEVFLGDLTDPHSILRLVQGCLRFGALIDDFNFYGGRQDSRGVGLLLMREID